MNKPYKVFCPGQRIRSFALLEWAKPYAEQVFRRTKGVSEIWKWVNDDNRGHYKTVAFYDEGGWHEGKDDAF